MCGIVGIFEYGCTQGSVSEQLLARMRDTMTHRGPDGCGLFVDPSRRTGLGHRRLAIVDLEGGAQPMEGEDGTCLVFNGEIYNYPRLRAELEADGARFRTNSDTEVILHLYHRHGERCVDYLTGMFAFALWNPAKQVLLFARDPIGEKPLYWASHHGVFVFASEIKALLEHPTVPREVNESALGPYLANLVSPAPQTLYRGVQKLPAGHLGVCDRQGVRVRQYWTATEPRLWDSPSRDASSRVRAMLSASVNDRLMSDVPVGVLLSGGFDSTAIVALLHERARGLATFTVGFPGAPEADERKEARWVAKHFRTDHHEVVVTESEALALLSPLIHHQDEPLADPVCVPLHVVCGLARKQGVKVVLAGEGADELFWGYTGYVGVLTKWPRYKAMLALPHFLRRFAARHTSGDRLPRRREVLEGIASGRMNPIHMPVGLTAYQRQRLIHSNETGAGWGPTAEISGEDPLTTIGFDTQEYEFGVRLPELLLMRIDRFSMANSVEARVPFLDPALVDYCYRLPLDEKVRAGRGKQVLRDALSDIVPSRVADRAKQGFAAPTSRWFVERHGQMLRGLMHEDSMRQYFDVSAFDRLLATADPTSWESGQVLWPLLNFALWHKYWIEGVSIEDVTDRAGAR